MPNQAIVRPSPSAPVNRMALGVDSVRLGGGETVDPSYTKMYQKNGYCFEGTAE